MILSSPLRASGRSVVPPPAWSFGLSDACPIMSSLSDLALASPLRFALRVYITALCKLPLLRSPKASPLSAFAFRFACPPATLQGFAFGDFIRFGLFGWLSLLKALRSIHPAHPLRSQSGGFSPLCGLTLAPLMRPHPSAPQGAPSLEHNRRGNGAGLPEKKKKPLHLKSRCRGFDPSRPARMISLAGTETEALPRRWRSCSLHIHPHKG